MERKATETVRTKMESLRLICDGDAQFQLQKMDSFTALFCNSMDSIKTRAEESVQNQGKIGRLKSSLREADDEFVKVVAVKTRKEAKQLLTRESISATRARIQELQKSVHAQRARRDEYATIMSQQSLALATSKETEHQDIDNKREIQEAMLWYNMVLGFKIEGDRGVKFTFKNINLKKPYEEYSFTVRYENDVYTLLACDLLLNDTKQLIHELNKTNGLFKFVRKMREKFQEAALLGFLPQSTTLHQEKTISVSAPVFSICSDIIESPMKTSQNSDEPKRNSKRSRRGRGGRQSILSPVSVRQSPRLKGKE